MAQCRAARRVLPCALAPRGSGGLHAWGCFAQNVSMPVYLFTYHAYRSWRPDDRRGFVQRDKGLQPPNPELAGAYDCAAKDAPFEFDADTQRFLIEVVLDVCRRREWRVHGAATEPSHLHALVSWLGEARWPAVRGKIKNVMSTALSKRAGALGRRWFAAGASRKHVLGRGHFDYLLGEYLPSHGGVGWLEGRGWVG